jgi:hypothetical protein
MALSVLTGIGFGVAPAFCLGRTELSTMGRTAQSPPRLRRLRTVLVVGQIAISLVLFSGSLALGRAFTTLMDVDNGFAVKRIATLTVSLAGTPQQDQGATYYPELLRRVRAVPGVVAASATQFLPLGATAFMGGRYTINSRDKTSRRPMASRCLVPRPPRAILGYGPLTCALRSQPWV